MIDPEGYTYQSTEKKLDRGEFTSPKKKFKMKTSRSNLRSLDRNSFEKVENDIKPYRSNMSVDEAPVKLDTSNLEKMIAKNSVHSQILAKGKQDSTAFRLRDKKESQKILK